VCVSVGEFHTKKSTAQAKALFLDALLHIRREKGPSQSTLVPSCEMLRHLLLFLAGVLLLLPDSVKGAPSTSLKAAWQKIHNPPVNLELPRADWKPARSEPTHAMLFATCTISSDNTAINGMVCSSSTNTLAIGCLHLHTAYVCNGVIWVAVVPTA